MCLVWELLCPSACSPFISLPSSPPGGTCEASPCVPLAAAHPAGTFPTPCAGPGTCSASCATAARRAEFRAGTPWFPAHLSPPSQMALALLQQPLQPVFGASSAHTGDTLGQTGWSQEWPHHAVPALPWHRDGAPLPAGLCAGVWPCWSSPEDVP